MLNHLKHNYPSWSFERIWWTCSLNALHCLFLIKLVSLAVYIRWRLSIDNSVCEIYKVLPKGTLKDWEKGRGLEMGEGKAWKWWYRNSGLIAKQSWQGQSTPFPQSSGASWHGNSWKLRGSEMHFHYFGVHFLFINKIFSFFVVILQLAEEFQLKLQKSQMRGWPSSILCGCLLA